MFNIGEMDKVIEAVNYNLDYHQEQTTMGKFKVGDKVRITRIQTSPHYDRLYTEAMHNIAGEIAIVNKIADHLGDVRTNLYSNFGNYWYIHESDLELVKEPTMMPESFRFERN